MLVGARLGAWAEENFGGKSVLEVTIPEGGGDFGFYLVQAPAGTLIEWGDGTTTPYTEKTHHYAEGGVYRVRIGKEATRFQCYQGTNPLYVTGFLAWGDNISNAHQTFQGCSGLSGRIPDWGAKISSAQQAFHGCSGLSGRIPDWGASITSANSTYSGCSGLSGRIPDWTDKIMNARATYSGCSGLSGRIPDWGAKISHTDYAFQVCTGLSGAIPAWGASITSARQTYYACRGLTSLWADGLTDEEIMPSRIENKAYCVSGTHEDLRKHFSPAWGGTKPVPTE